ncbi:MAG: ankyrin repeat domain-containing protein [SAR324 cluster bacterium]|nr:ankyrin repeat domain-containing protein [SAR324 cluster bacterium]
MSLHQAILDEDKEVIVELLDAGHSVEILNSDGWSPLMLAVVW